MFSVGDDLWKARIQIHATYYPFSARVFTTTPVNWLGQLMGGRYELAFALIQYTLLTFVGFLFYRFLRQLHLSPGFARAGLLAFFTSYPVVAAFHLGVESWDDFWQYGALILAFGFLLQRQWLWSAVALSFGVAAREPTIFFYPVWSIALLRAAGRWRHPRILILLMPLLLLAVVWFVPSHELAAKTISSITENFRNAEVTRNSLYSLFMGQGFLWVLLPVALLRARRDCSLEPSERFLRWGTVLTLPLVIALVLTSAYARESRLFFPPFVLGLPLLLRLIAAQWEQYRPWLQRARLPMSALAGLVCLAACGWLSLYLFPWFDYRSAHDFARAMFALHLAVGFVFLFPLILPAARTAGSASTGPC